MGFDVYNWDLDSYCHEKVAEVSFWRQELEPLGEGALSFVTELERQLEAGLRWLDRLDRSEPFWNGRNHLPTLFKLETYTSQLLTTSAAPPEISWYHLAAYVSHSGCHCAGHPVWEVGKATRIEISWFVAGAWLDKIMWNDDESLIPDVRQAGRIDEYRDALTVLTGSANVDVREWAAAELAKCV